jgi:outer membrane protein TolC
MYHLERKRTQAGYWPTLSAFGNYQYQAFRPEFSFLQFNQSWYRASVVGVTLDVPLFDGLRRQAQMRQSYLRMKAAESQAGQLQESIALELENATARLENARAALRQQRDNRQLAEQVYAQVQLQYKTGVTPLADLLNAETDLQTAQNNYVQALIQLKLSALQLRKINGSLTETR